MKNPLIRLKRGATPSGSSLRSQYDPSMSDALPRSPGLQHLSPSSDGAWPSPRPHTPLYSGSSGIFIPGNQSSLSLSQKSSSPWPPSPLDGDNHENSLDLAALDDDIFGYITISRADSPFTESDELSVSRPKPPTNLRRMSELIDPQSLASVSNIVESPSGNVLTKEEFAAREDRPLSLRERQERIRQEASRSQSYAVCGTAAPPPTPRTPPLALRNLYNIPEEDLVALPPLPDLPDLPEPAVKKKPNKTRCFCF